MYPMKKTNLYLESVLLVSITEKTICFYLLLIVNIVGNREILWNVLGLLDFFCDNLDRHVPHLFVRT